MKLYLNTIICTILMSTSTFAAAQVDTVKGHIDMHQIATDSETTGSSSEWQSKKIKVSFTGSGVKRDYRGKFYTAEALYSGDANTKGNVAFICYTGNFTVNVALKPVALQTMLTNPPDSTRRKIRRPNIEVGGERIKNEDWVYMPAMNVYKSRRKISARKLYNNVVRGDTVTMKSDGSGDQLLNLPPINDAFKDFGAGCGMGRNATK